MIEAKPNFEDKRLTCAECGKPFTFTASEQLFFWSKNLKPRLRCHSCCQRRKRTILPGQARDGL